MTGSAATVYEFDIPTRAAEPETPPIPFKINNGERFEFFQLRRPKMSIAMGMVQLIEEQDQHSPQDFGVKLAHLMWGLVAYVVPEPPEPATVPVEPDDPNSEQVPNPYAGALRGRGRLYQRLNDADDDMDILDLEPMFRNMIEVMFDRPTGPSPASDTRRGDGGTDSEAATPARPARTSGTSRRASSSRQPRTSSASGSRTASGTARRKTAK